LPVRGRGEAMMKIGVRRLPGGGAIFASALS
jgi:hypothetical protein